MNVLNCVITIIIKQTISITLKISWIPFCSFIFLLSTYLALKTLVINRWVIFWECNFILYFFKVNISFSENQIIIEIQNFRIQPNLKLGTTCIDFWHLNLNPLCFTKEGTYCICLLYLLIFCSTSMISFLKSFSFHDFSIAMYSSCVLQFSYSEHLLHYGNW